MPKQIDTIEVAKRVLETEIDGLNALIAALDGEFSRCVDMVSSIKGRLICAGVGKSGHVARKIAATLASTGTPAQFIHPTEASHGDLGMIGSDDAILILSKSGEAPELADMIGFAHRFSINLIAMTAKPLSQLGKAANYHLLIPDSKEACAETRAPTTSTTLQMALGDCLAVALIEKRGFTASDFRNFHPGGKLGAMLKSANDLMHKGNEVPIVKAHVPMREVLLEMTQKRLGVTSVVDDDGKLIGIITDGDVRRLGSNIDFFNAKANEIMTMGPMTITADTLAADALAKLNETKRTVLLIIDDANRPIGVLHIHDLLTAGVV